MYMRYCVESVARYSWDNKLIVFLGLLSFSLFVSTWVLAVQRNSVRQELADCKASGVTTTETVVQSTTGAPEEPKTDAPAVEGGNTSVKARKLVEMLAKAAVATI